MGAVTVVYVCVCLSLCIGANAIKIKKNCLLGEILPHVSLTLREDRKEKSLSA